MYPGKRRENPSVPTLYRQVASVSRMKRNVSLSRYTAKKKYVPLTMVRFLKKWAVTHLEDCDWYKEEDLWKEIKALFRREEDDDTESEEEVKRAPKRKAEDSGGKYAYTFPCAEGVGGACNFIPIHEPFTNREESHGAGKLPLDLASKEETETGDDDGEQKEPEVDEEEEEEKYVPSKYGWD
jgi:hypothetical protein